MKTLDLSVAAARVRAAEARLQSNQDPGDLSEIVRTMNDGHYHLADPVRAEFLQLRAQNVQCLRPLSGAKRVSTKVWRRICAECEHHLKDRLIRHEVNRKLLGAIQVNWAIALLNAKRKGQAQQVAMLAMRNVDGYELLMASSLKAMLVMAIVDASARKGFATQVKQTIDHMEQLTPEDVELRQMCERLIARAESRWFGRFSSTLPTLDRKFLYPL